LYESNLISVCVFASRAADRKQYSGASYLGPKFSAEEGQNSAPPVAVAVDNTWLGSVESQCTES